MKEIIGKPNYFESVCPHCGCKFKYEQCDVFTKRIGSINNSYFDCVDCPNCETSIRHRITDAYVKPIYLDESEINASGIISTQDDVIKYMFGVEALDALKNKFVVCLFDPTGSIDQSMFKIRMFDNKLQAIDYINDIDRMLESTEQSNLEILVNFNTSNNRCKPLLCFNIDDN